MTLHELAELIGRYSSGEIHLDEVHEQLLPVLAADPLDVEASDSAPWDQAHADARLFWRLVYLFESEPEDSATLRRTGRRVVACLGQTGSADVTFELLPLILDQDRLVTIVGRHRAGIISRTGFLSVLAESGYPPHVKLWLEHAGDAALRRLSAAFGEERYDSVSSVLSEPPG